MADKKDKAIRQVDDSVVCVGIVSNAKGVIRQWIEWVDPASGKRRIISRDNK